MKDAVTPISGKAGESGKRLRVGAAAVAVVAVLGAVAFAARAMNRTPVVQPVRFNHALHARLNATCDVCHAGCEKGQAAGYPGASTCKECHDPAGEPAGKSPEEQVLRGLLSQGGEVAWRRVDALPADVRFSHALHVKKAKIDCARCHGEIGASAAPPEESLRAFRMDDCMGCHAGHAVAGGCVTCHR